VAQGSNEEVTPVRPAVWFSAEDVGGNIMRTRTLSRRHLVQGSALAAGAALMSDRLAAASSGQPGGQSARVGKAAAAKEISFMNWDVVNGTPLETAINAFEKQAGIKVNIQPAPSGSEYDTKMRTELASGSPPDIIRINDDYVRGFSLKEKALLDLTSYIKSNKVDTAGFYQNVYGFPDQPNGTHTAWTIGVQPRLIYYNVDMFQSTGTPLPPSTWTSEGWTWDDFVNSAKKLTKEGDRWGGLIYYDTGYEQTFTVNNGDEDGTYSADGKTFTMASPKGIEAVQWAADLTCVHKVQPPWSMLPDGQHTDQQLFSQGKLGMFFSTFGTVTWLRENVKDFKWDVAPPPAKVNQKQEGSLIVFTIPKDAKNPDEAFQLLSFLSGPDAGKIFAESGYFVPVLKSAATLLKPGEEPPQHIDLFQTAADHQTTINFTANTLRARQIYRPELDNVYNCESSAKDVLTRVKPDVEAALAAT
jgi:multiple sugar transport system substrate-binding protein